MDISIIVNILKKQSITDNMVANSTHPLTVPISAGEKIVIRDSSGNYIKKIISKKDNNDLLILSDQEDELVRIEDYFATENVDVVSVSNNEYISYKFTDAEFSSLVPEIAEAQNSALVVDVLEGNTSLGWGSIAGIFGGGLAIAGLANVISDDNDQTETINITPDPTPNNPPTSDNTVIKIEEDKVATGKLSKAYDIDGDTLTYALAGQPANGSVTVQADGTYTYTPNSDFHGTDSFSYTIDDGNGGKIEQKAAITVSAENDIPTATNTAITVTEDEVATGKLSEANDVDGDALTYAIAEQPTNGSVTVEEDGSYTYTPNPNFNGTDSFTYTIDDGNGGKITRTANITVNEEIVTPPVNNPPTSENTVISIEEDNVAKGKLTASDADGDTLTFALVQQPKHGTISLKSDGTYTYAPNSDFYGTDSFTYTIDDGNGGKIEQKAAITVSAENDIPTATNTAITVTEDEVATGKLAASDADGDTLTFALVQQPKHGTISLESDGTYTYTPNSDFHGTDSFSYTIDDGNGGKIEQKAAITVSAENDIPTATDTSITVTEDKVATGKLAASDADGDSLAFTLVQQPNNGTINLKSDGTYTYTPNSDFHGTDSFTYTIDDGNGGTITRTANITVKPLNNNPDIIHNDNMSELTFVYTGQDRSKLFSVLIDDDSIYIGGNSKNGLVHKLDTKGNLDPNYTVEVNPYIDNIQEIPGMAILDDGSLFVSNFNNSNDYLSKITSEGVLDTNFKGIDPYAPGDGVMDLEYFGGWDVRWNSMTTTSDNKILVAGMSRKLGSEDDLDMTIARLNADGTPDSTFNHGGQIEGENPGENVIGLDGLDDHIFSIIETADGKILAGGHFIDENGHQEILLARFNSDGTLDSSFHQGTNMPGIVTFDLNWNASIKGMVEGEDGNIYAIASDYTHPKDMTIISFKPDGSLNTDFNPGGETNGGEGSFSGVIFEKNMNPTNLRLTQDNKLLLTSDETIDELETYMSKLNLDGSLDESFNYTQNKPGIKAVRPGAIVFEDTIVNSFDINDANEIIAVGYETDQSNSSMTSAKIFSLDATGNYSGNFEVNNIDTTDNPTPNHVPVSENTDISVEEDDSVTGQLAEATDPDAGQTLTYALKEQASNGMATVGANGSYTYTPNPDFNGTDSFTYTIDDGNGGKITRTANITIKPLSNNPDITHTDNMSELTFVYAGQDKSKLLSVLIDDNDSIYIGGNSKNGLVLKLDANGNLDTDYTIEANPYIDSIEEIPGMAMLNDGSLLAVSYFQNNDYLSKINNEGILDNSFKGSIDTSVGDGVINLKTYGGHDFTLNALMTTDSDKILLAGFSRKNEQSDLDLTITRLNNDGSIDTSFNMNGENPGLTVTGIEGLDDKLFCMTETADGKILAGGHFIDENGHQEILLARFNSDGTLDTSFHKDTNMPGIVTFDLEWSASIKGLVEAEDGNIYAIASDYTHPKDMTIISFKPDGSLNTDFNHRSDSDEGVISRPGLIFIDNTTPIDIKLTNDNKIIIAADEVIDEFETYLVKLNLDGSFDTSFNHNNDDLGITSKNPGIIDFDNTIINSFDINSSNEIIAVGYETNPSNPSMTVAKIISLDATGNYTGNFEANELQHLANTNII